MRHVKFLLLCLLVLPAQPAFSQPKLFIEQGMLSIESGAGRVFAKHEVKGAELVISGARLRIDDVIEKTSATGQNLFFYQLSSFNQASKSWQPFCQRDPQGQQLALLYHGNVDAVKGYQAVSQISITCSAGVIAKCINWGYSPYADHPKAAALFNTCLRMARADYCGTGESYTRDGTLLNIYDRFGIQKSEPESEKEGLVFEAAWNENGALCVHHPRIQENIDIENLIKACPKKFSASNTGEACSQKNYPDALIYNDSRQTAAKRVDVQ